MDKRCKKLLHEIMECGFIQTELTLFLDTHPEDRKALEDYNQISRQMDYLVAEYTKCCMPLVVQDYATMMKYPWQWIETPWPWEIDY